MTEPETTAEQAPEAADDPRAALAEGLSAYLTREQIDALLGEALALTKRVDVSCPHCRKRSPVEISDGKAVVSAVSDLLVQGFGRPGEQRKGGGDVIVNRTVQYVCEHGHECPECEKEPVRTVRSPLVV